MLFKAAILEGIGAGRVDRAFRCWKAPTVKAGGTLRTAVGVLAIDRVSEIDLSEITEDEARRAGFAAREDAVRSLGGGTGGTLYRIEFHLAGPDPRDLLRASSALSPSELEAALDRLDHLDRRGAWTRRVLALIGEKEGRTAAEIAEALALEKAALKRRVRLLKEMGLTESLQSGYRLSPRGRRLLGEIDRRSDAGA